MSPSGGIMMELVPLRVLDPPGSRTTFSCSYRSNERLTIEFEALTLLAETEERAISKREVMAEGVAAAAAGRYSWGANRKWSRVLAEDDRMVVCRLKNSFGLLVGQLYSVIGSGSKEAFYSYYQSWALATIIAITRQCHDAKKLSLIVLRLSRVTFS